MKVFRLSIYKGHDLKQCKEVIVNTKEELITEKRIFWNESHFKKNMLKNWMGVKRIR